MKHSIYNVFVSFAITFSVVLIQVILIVIVTFSLFNSTATRWSHYHSFVMQCLRLEVCMYAYMHVCKTGGGGECETELERQAYGQTEKLIDMMTET